VKAGPVAAAGEQRPQHGAPFGGESLQRARHVLVVLPVTGGAHLVSAV
jgi:hypothetical protein